MASIIEGSSIQESSFTQRPGVTSTAGDESSVGGIAQASKEQAKQLGGVARERVYQRVDSRKGELIKGLQGLVSTLEGASRSDESAMVRPLLNGAVGFLRRTSDRLEHGSTEELLRDAQAQVRERPGLFIAGCVAVGFALGRFIKV